MRVNGSLGYLTPVKYRQSRLTSSY
ncbi:TPA: hypothetical protein ACQOJZ_000344 [Streptococcus pyogenes]